MRGCVDAWMRGCVDAWMRGYVDTWIRGYVDTWIRGYVGSNSRAPGHSNIEVQERRKQSFLQTFLFYART
jgi:hypothetical protein